MKSTDFKTQIFFKVALFSLCLLSGCSKSGSNPTPKNTQPSVTIASLNTLQGPYNSMVIITGTGFSTTFNGNQVYFNGKAATIESYSSTQIYADVPLAAGTGNITVKVNGVTTAGPVFTYQPSLVVTTFAGNMFQGGTANGTGENARFNSLAGLAIDKNGNLYAADEGNTVIRKITPQAVVTTLAGSGKQGNTDGTASVATFEDPTAVAVDQQGNVFIGDSYLLRKITPDGTVSTIATHLNAGLSIGYPMITAITVDGSGNLYITDKANHLVEKVTADGNITAIAGPNSTSIVSPYGIVLDNFGNLFITDGLIWKITPQNIVSKFVAGSADGQGFSNPKGIAIDNKGNFYIADTGNLAVKEITASGIVTTVAGNTNNAALINGIVSKASFGFPTGIAVDALGNVFVADANAIREISVQ